MRGYLYWLKDTIFSPECQAKPKRGDLIEIFRSGYRHWAVYVGSGYVVHLGRPNSFPGDAGSKALLDRTVVVKKEKLSAVAGTDYCRINNKHDSTYPVLSPDQIVSRAEKLVGQMLVYELTTRNCEHFANSLRYNVARSDQVWDNALLGMAATVLLLLGKLTVGSINRI